MTTTPTHCLECNAPLSPAETQGLCARCLLRAGLATQRIDGSIGSAGARTLVAPPEFPFDFGSYRVLRLLGRGGMGAVYEAEDSASGRRIALKVLGHSLDSADSRKRFIREGRLAAAINHPNSVYVYGTEEIDDTPVITMELVPGGTLHDRVKAGGPMPVGEAVDAILQVIAGLEAAHTAGILHRDVKPSNCFIEPGGAVKVGDFGLSISTLSRGDSALTAAGSILGTPAFSAPEQLRGEALDVRADIYSVGVTLYYLLTGRAPFEGENLVALLATVLEKSAPSPRTFRPEIPEALARIILRCLAKQSGDRWKGYDELRRALRPFGTTAPTPATLALRFAAALIDAVVFVAVTLPVQLLMFGDLQGIMDGAAMESPRWLWYGVGVLLFEIAYFAVCEGRWGATPGKALVGLRVGGLDRQAPGMGRATLRALIYLVPTIVTVLFSLGAHAATAGVAWQFVGLIAYYLYPALLASTARRHNGYATVIDLLTKTRVIQRTAYEGREALAPSEEPVATTQAMRQVGPYHVLAPLSAEGGFFLGYDAKLLRRVWIREVPADTAPVAAGLSHAARPGRLRWLQGRRGDGESWDAYEAASGTPLTALLRAPQSWKSVRHWLLDLAAEFAAAMRDGSMPETLALDRIWITASGGAKLLDFPAPGSGAVPAPTESDGGGTPPLLEPAVFLNQIAISALEGRVATGEEARTGAVRVPVAVRARGFLHGLRAAVDFTALAGELSALVRQRPVITHARRLGLVAGCVIPTLLLGVFMAIGLMAYASWAQGNPDILRLRTALDIHERMAQGIFPRDVKPAIGLEPAETFIAGRFGPLVKNPEVWSAFYAVSTVPAEQRERAERIVNKFDPPPSADAMTAARAGLGGAIDADGELNIGKRFGEVSHGPDTALWIAMPFGGFIWTALFSVVAALFFRGGLLMRSLGIAVVRRDGSDASRWRLLWRAFVAWSWMPLGVFVAALLVPALKSPTAFGLVGAVVVCLVVYSAARCKRSLPDLLAGTWLVPR
ncbi:MAG: protein kinase [Chthoniobacteraceae bacterium]